MAAYPLNFNNTFSGLLVILVLKPDYDILAYDEDTIEALIKQITSAINKILIFEKLEN